MGSERSGRGAVPLGTSGVVGIVRPIGIPRSPGVIVITDPGT
jgi:hypothetical protein